jgi:hypothetical protein
MTMTVQQALAFVPPYSSKPLRDMSRHDWSRMFRKIDEHQTMTDAFWRHQWDDEMDQRAHASADRLDDLIKALRIILED